ncbi:ABC transporter ATP-binding protein [Actinomadura sp. 6K520]|uniref:ABC transporter ATP-binding protein n=1 Tax=Actinomadura sp. 6K520 TaxID=2530364 RepID=UPI00104E0339|nr:ABC transporter ATP-binding protein [Actinomadura sp. 6K520]TDE35467.1 ABC transporter ATP-binding protein [Actinomadura sp. 6K520]
MSGLTVSGLEVSYGAAVRALHEVSLSVPDGSIVAVLGANGAGKSTLMRAVSGTLRFHGGLVESGEIRYGGRRLDGAAPHTAVAAGIVQSPEGRRVFGRMTVADNLRAGALTDRRHAARARHRVHKLFPVLAERSAQRASLLSGGEQQMLAMGRALMASPKLLLLDEPTLGLAPLLTARIAETITEINEQGVSVLLVEQNAALALRLSSHAYVLDVGRVALSGPSADLAAGDEIGRRYLGVTGDRAPLAARRQITRWSA